MTTAKQTELATTNGHEQGSLMSFIDRAMTDPNFDVNKLDSLLATKERWEANEARKAYSRAFAAFKSESVEIYRNTTVTDGPLKGKGYADLYSAVNAITPALAKHGLSASWRITRDEKDWIEVACTISHIDGHSESVSMGGPPDAGGAKNAIQARASTVNYLERYTLLAATGLAVKGVDNDGRPQNPKANEFINDDQKSELKRLIEDDGRDVDSFLKWAGADELSVVTVGKYEEACKMIRSSMSKKAKGGKG